MRFVYPEYDISFEIKENRVNVFAIENPKIMTEILGELYQQEEGMDGKFVLSENNKILNFSKSVYVMPNLFQLNLNDRKILNHLYQKMEEVANENLVNENIQLNAYISKYLNQICEQFSYQLDFKTQFAPIDLLKLGAVQFINDSGNLLENIIQYINVVANLLSTKLLIFFNLKLYLSVEELHQLYEYVFYHKISILLIEGTTNIKMEEEDVLIIDKDCCKIKI